MAKSSQEYINDINEIYEEYLKNPKCVFKSCDKGKKIVILEKPSDHTNNECRSSIINKKKAIHRGTSMNVKLIFDKFSPKIVFDKTHSYYENIETLYEIGKNVNPDKYTYDNSENSHGIYYCLSFDGPFYQDLDLIKYTGEIIKFNYNGTTKYKGYLLNGLKHGEFNEFIWNYNENANQNTHELISTKNYLQDELHGESICFYPNGNILSKGNYFNGTKIGMFYCWYENGVKKSEEYYDKNGLRHREWLYWKDDGTRHLLKIYNYGKIISETNYDQLDDPITDSKVTNTYVDYIDEIFENVSHDGHSDTDSDCCNDCDDSCNNHNNHNNKNKLKKQYDYNFWKILGYFRLI